MEMTQVYTLTNTIYNEMGGTSAVVAEDLSNVVDIGNEIFSSTSMDKFVGSLVDHIGKMVFVDRPYRGLAPSVLRDGWEYGAVLEKVQADLPVAVVNSSWDLTDQQSYDPNIFYKPIVSAKFYNQRVTFEVDISITDLQVRSAFSSPTQLNAFYSMIYNAVDRAITTRLDGLIMRAINNMTAHTLHSDYPDADYTTKSGVKAVNLLKLYNAQHDEASLTAETAITNPDFNRFAVYQMLNYMDRLKVNSTLFNVGAKARFTPPEYMTAIMLSNFKNAADVFLQSSTFHDRYTALPNADTVPYWQGSGTDYSFSSISSIHVTIKDDSSKAEVTCGGVLAVLFDRDALGVTNFDRRVTSNYNPKAEFTNNFYKQDAGYFNDLNENFVVFFVA